MKKSSGALKILKDIRSKFEILANTEPMKIISQSWQTFSTFIGENRAAHTCKLIFTNGMVFIEEIVLHLLRSDTICFSPQGDKSCRVDFQSDLRTYPKNLIWTMPAKGKRLTKRLFCDK
jgi:hypothetical protein